MPWKTCGGRLYAQHGVAHACRCDMFLKMCFLCYLTYFGDGIIGPHFWIGQFTVILVGSLMMG